MNLPDPPGDDRPFDVVCVGNALVDCLALVGRDVVEELGLVADVMTLVDLPRAEEIRRRVGTYHLASGGSAANTAVGVASLGGRPAFVGTVATDDFGLQYEKDLARAGVEPFLFRVEARDGAHTGRCFVLVTPDAQRTLATTLGVASELDRTHTSLSGIAGSRICYIEGYLYDAPGASAAIDGLIGAAKDAGTLLALSLSDPFIVERHGERIAEIVAGPLDMLFGNEHEAMALAGASSLDEALRKLRRPGLLVVVTKGAAGAVADVDGARVEVAAAVVPEVLDVTGAGDLFAAGVLAALSRQRDLETALHLGALAAGEVIGHLGPRPEGSLVELAAKAGLLA